jgi:hypothetical protein
MASSALTALGTGLKLDEDMQEVVLPHGMYSAYTTEDAKVRHMMNLIKAWDEQNNSHPVDPKTLEQTEADFEGMKTLFQQKFNLFLKACEELSRESKLVRKLREKEEKQIDIHIVPKTLEQTNVGTAPQRGQSQCTAQAHKPHSL